jgi:putative phosphoesterase
MRIAVLSDTHSRYATVEAALDLIKAERVDLILHCGDIDDADTVWLFPPNTHFVFGNCDHDRTALGQAIHGIGATLHEPYGSLDLPGGKVAFVHGDIPSLFHHLEEGGVHDYLFYGHTHHAEEHHTGPTHVINPGALQRARIKTFVILDLENGSLQSLKVE